METKFFPGQVVFPSGKGLAAVESFSAHDEFMVIAIGIDERWVKVKKSKQKTPRYYPADYFQARSQMG